MLKLSNCQPHENYPFPNDNMIESESSSVSFQVPNSIPESSVQQPTEIRIPVFSSDQEEGFGSQESPSNGERIREEQASFFRKIFAILAGIIAWIILAIDETDNVKKMENLGLIALSCLAFCTVENLMFCIRQYLTGKNYKELLSDALDGVLAGSFSLAVMCWDEESTSKCWLFISPFLYLIYTCKYIKEAMSSSRADKHMKIFMMVCLTIQVSLITAKLFGYLAFMSWTTVFFPLGCYLVGHQIYGSYILVKLSVKLFKEGEIENLSFIRGSFRMSCNVVNHGLILLVFGIFTDLCSQIEEGEDIQGPLGKLLLFAECLNGLLLGYALIFFKLVRGLDPELSDEFDQEIISHAKSDSLTKKYSLVPQKDGIPIGKFLRISPTYFVKTDENQDNKEQEISETEEINCYICEENEPNIILMSCGHGGMCKGCVLQSMKKNNSCMQCRKPVSSIYQIKKEEKRSGIVEACETFTIVC